MNSLQKISGGIQRLLESNNEEIIVFLVIFLFIFLGKADNREADEITEDAERGNSGGTIVFLIAFLLVLIFGGIFEDELL